MVGAVKLEERPRSGSVSKLVARFERKAEPAAPSPIILVDHIKEASQARGLKGSPQTTPERAVENLEPLPKEAPSPLEPLASEETVQEELAPAPLQDNAEVVLQAASVREEALGTSSSSLELDASVDGNDDEEEAACQGFGNTAVSFVAGLFETAVDDYVYDSEDEDLEAMAVFPAAEVTILEVEGEDEVDNSDDEGDEVVTNEVACGMVACDMVSMLVNQAANDSMAGELVKEATDVDVASLTAFDGGAWSAWAAAALKDAFPEELSLDIWKGHAVHCAVRSALESNGVAACADDFDDDAASVLSVGSDSDPCLSDGATEGDGRETTAPSEGEPCLEGLDDVSQLLETPLPRTAALAPCTRSAFRRRSCPVELGVPESPFPMDCLPLSEPVAPSVPPAAELAAARAGRWAEAAASPLPSHVFGSMSESRRKLSDEARERFLHVAASSFESLLACAREDAARLIQDRWFQYQLTKTTKDALTAFDALYIVARNDAARSLQRRWRRHSSKAVNGTVSLECVMVLPAVEPVALEAVPPILQMQEQVELKPAAPRSPPQNQGARADPRRRNFGNRTVATHPAAEAMPERPQSAVAAQVQAPPSPPMPRPPTAPTPRSPTAPNSPAGFRGNRIASRASAKAPAPTADSSAAVPAPPPSPPVSGSSRRTFKSRPSSGVDKRAAAREPVVFRMDDDADEPTAAPAASAVRTSSLARGYQALGAEVHAMDSDPEDGSKIVPKPSPPRHTKASAAFSSVKTTECPLTPRTARQDPWSARYASQAQRWPGSGGTAGQLRSKAFSVDTHSSRIHTSNTAQPRPASAARIATAAMYLDLGLPSDSPVSPRRGVGARLLPTLSARGDRSAIAKALQMSTSATPRGTQRPALF